MPRTQPSKNPWRAISPASAKALSIKIQESLPLLTLIVLSLVAYHSWLSFKLFFHADWWPSSFFTISHNAVATAWSSGGFGSPNILLSRAPAQMVQGALAHTFHVGTNVTDKFVYFLPVIVLLPAAGYFLARYAVDNRWVAALGGIIFAFNTYVISMNYEGDEMITIAMAACVLAFVVFLRITQDDRGIDWYKAAAATAWLAFASAYDFRIVYITVLMLGLLVIALWSKRALIHFLVLAGLLVGLSLFWLLPMEISGSLTSNAAFNRSLFGDIFWTLPASLAFFFPFWTGHEPSWFVDQPVPIYLWPIPIAMVIALIKLRRTREFLFFAGIAIIGVLLTKQVQPPFTGLYGWLFNHVPGFNAFREASKFNIMLAISYTFLLVNLVWGLISNRNKLERYAGYLLGAYVAVTYLANAIPIANGQIGGTMAARREPQSYRAVNTIVDRPSASFFRTYWLPSNPPWADSGDAKPAISAAENGQIWQSLLNISPNLPEATQLLAQIDEPISKVLFAAGSIRYVAIPVRDISNAADFFVYYGNDRQVFQSAVSQVSWLKKIMLPNSDVDWYKNDSAKPYLSTATSLTNLPDFLNLNSVYGFASAQLKLNDFNFESKQSSAPIPSQSIGDLFEHVMPDQIKPGVISTSTGILNQSAMLYANRNQPYLSYSFNPNQIKIFTGSPGEITVGGHSLSSPSPPSTLATIPVVKSDIYYLAFNNSILPMAQTAGLNLGLIKQGPVRILTQQGANLVPDPSFESGLWQSKVGDCNDYDANPQIAMTDDTSMAADGRHSLLLGAASHTACTESSALPVTPSTPLRLSLMYEVANTDHAGFYLVFDDPQHTRVEHSLPSRSVWTQYSDLEQVPSGATHVRITLTGYPSPQYGQSGITHYDNVQLTPMQVVANAPTNVTPIFVSEQLSPNTQIEYHDPQITAANLIPNASLRGGPWQSQVSDCNNYDDNPAIGMKLLPRMPINSENALELDASRHVACTGPDPINVSSIQNLYLSFAYESPNANQAAFHIQFNDPAGTQASHSVTITDKAWHTYSTVIPIPVQATRAQIVFYSYPSTTGLINTKTRYSSFVATSVPDIGGDYYSVTAAPATQAPKKITWNSLNPDLKTINISSARSGFYLNMSEAYAPQWQAQVVHGRTVAPLNSAHYEWDGFANGWYINTEVLCKTNDLCSVNSDGTYNFKIVINYTPQSWVHIGSFLSAVSVGCIGTFLAVLAVARVNTKKRKMVTTPPAVRKRRNVRL